MKDEHFKHKPQYSLIRALVDQNMDTQEVWRAYDIYPHEVLLPKGVPAFVYVSQKGSKHIFINTTLSNSEKAKLLFHELSHIIEHLPQIRRIVGLNMQQMYFEEQADLFFHEVAAVYDVK